MTTVSLSEIDFGNYDSAVEPDPTDGARQQRPTHIDLTHSYEVA